MQTTYRAGILTVSDKGARGERADESGDAAEEILKAAGYRVEKRAVVPDEREEIERVLLEWCDVAKLSLALTSGGTGFSVRDLTPEATLAVIQRPAPGISEAMRLAGLEKTPSAMLSRGVSGIRGGTLILNLPGSVKGVRESLEAVIEALPHGIEVLAGEAGECGTES